MDIVTTRLIAERRFYVGAAVGVVVIVLAGFSIDVDLLRDMSGLSALVRLHGLVMFGWIALFVTQTVLVVRHRVDLHRRLGIFGAVLAALVRLARLSPQTPDTPEAPMKMRYLSTMIAVLLASLAGCTDLMPGVTDPTSDESALLALEGHGPAAAQNHEFERALTVAARREH